MTTHDLAKKRAYNQTYAQANRERVAERIGSQGDNTRDYWAKRRASMEAIR